MGNEAGYGYQGPPETGMDLHESIRARELEDYVSRRIKARVQLTTADQVILPSAEDSIIWDTLDYDTSQLWDGGTQFIVPRGGEGDFFVAARAFIFLSGGAGTVTVVFKLLKLDENGNTLLLDYSFENLSSGIVRDIRINYFETMRPGEQFWVTIANGSPTNNLHVVGSFNPTFPSFLAINRTL